MKIGMREASKHHYNFVKRVTRNLFIGTSLTFISLLAGMWGYHYYESMPLVDAYVNAAMILSGMGPVNSLQTEGGKIFAGSYALFSGIFFLFLMAIVFSPVIHHTLHKLHMDESR